MNVIICDKLKEDDERYFRFGWRTPYQELESLGWKTVDQKEISGTISEFFLTTFGELPRLLLFWNSAMVETFDLIYRNIDDLIIHKWIKCISLDDLHKDKHREPRFESIILKNFDYVVITYPNVFPKFFKTISPNKIISCPHSINNKFITVFNGNPVNQVLLSGCLTKKYYPFRYRVYELSQIKINAKTRKYPIALLKNLSYVKANHNNYGYNYLKYLNKYLACITSSSTEKLPYVIAKFFEIPASGSLLLAEDKYIKEPLHELGFIDGENYLSVNFDNLEERLFFVTNPSNREYIDKIRRNGYEFVWNNHTLMHRVKAIHEKLCTEAVPN